MLTHYTHEELDFTRQLGRRVRTLRAVHGLSQPDLGALVGLSRQAVTAVERGTVAVSLVNLRRLAQALEVPMATLVDGPLIIQ